MASRIMGTTGAPPIGVSDRGRVNSRRMSLVSEMLLAVASIVVTAIAIELGARILYGSPSLQGEPPARWLDLIEDLPERDQFLQDRETFLRGEPLVYRDYHLYSQHPFQSETLVVTDYYSARRCPDAAPLGHGDVIAWMFGGSTMQNMEAPDRRTIANQVAVALLGERVSATVMNFGVGSFQTSLELIKFQDLIRKVSDKERPDFVVFYDGFNDSNHAYLFGAGSIQADLRAKLAILVEGRNLDLVRYGAAQWATAHSAALGRWVAPHLVPATIHAGIVRDASDGNLKRAVATYLGNLAMIRETARAFGIRPLFVLQPLVVTKQGLTEFERKVFQEIGGERTKFVRDFYQEVRIAMHGEPDFLDLSSLLDRNRRDDFYDLGHTGPYTGTDVGGAIARAIVRAAGSSLPMSAGRGEDRITSGVKARSQHTRQSRRLDSAFRAT